ncbi:hypothetical protein [Streptosporangium sp. NPDC006007]|uniref:hypothetical protein n=1 Tax=Streptosporangium sp. NPDC006007 TaxID=3154575 RepID=UPI0033B1D69F
MGKNEAAKSETEAAIIHLKSQLPPNDPFVRLEEVCLKSRIAFEWRSIEPEGQPLELENIQPRVGIPNGQQKRWRTLSREKAQNYLLFNVSTVKAIGDYDAFYYSDEGIIEASVYPLVRFPGPPSLHELPGVEIQRGLTHVFDTDLDSEEPALNKKEYFAKRIYLEDGDEWNLEFQNTQRRPWKVSIGTSSLRFSAFSDSFGGRRVTIKIGGVSSSRHDDLLDILNRISGATLFEIDLRYGIAVNLRKARLAGNPRGRRRRVTPSTELPKSPENDYLQRPLSLYWYGRSARGMPLLEFLAFYQVLEYHFPTYSQREALEKIRQELRDPRFEREDDRHISKIISLAGQGGKFQGKERDQLKATIRACTPPERIQEFMNEVPGRLEHFTSNQISEVPHINLKNDQDLRDQAASRIYELRCRIVHSKGDGGEKYSEMLLPFSEEADHLGSDIDLVHFLAQKVLIASSSKLRP